MKGYDTNRAQRRVVERAHVEQWRIAACKCVRPMQRGVDTICKVRRCGTIARQDTGERCASCLIYKERMTATAVQLFALMQVSREETSV